MRKTKTRLATFPTSERFNTLNSRHSDFRLGAFSIVSQLHLWIYPHIVISLLETKKSVTIPKKANLIKLQK